LKRLFTNPFCQWLFGRLHPNLGITLADYCSGVSRNSQDEGVSGQFLGEDREFLVQHSKSLLQHHHADYFIYGHRHYPIQLDLNGHSQYVNLGDWITHFTYAAFDGESLQLKTFEG